VAFLKVIQGSVPGQILELTGERVVIGRHPNCEIVLDNAAVSRHHAQILESHGRYYIEDMRSRNRTRLNEQRLEGRTELREADAIKVCEVVFQFHHQMPPTDDISYVDERETTSGAAAVDHDFIVPASLPVGDEFFDDPPDASSIVSTINTRSVNHLRLNVKPEAKLRAVLEIGRSLGSVLNLDDVLQNTLSGLFTIYPQADEGFVVLKDGDDGKLRVRATRSRNEASQTSVRISTTVIHQAMRAGDAILSADTVGDKRFDMSESISDLKIKSMICVPLIGKSGEALGVVQLDSMDLRQQFSQDDLDVLVSVTSQISLAVENAKLHNDLLEQREMQRDLEFASQVQLGFLPDERPKLDGFQFSDYYEAALRVGGDYFDYLSLPGNRIAVAMGDVAGKGIPAALLMARLYSSTRFHLLTQPTIAEAVDGLNAEIASSGLGFRFITFVVVILDPNDTELTVVNAGHLPPLVRTTEGTIRSLPKECSGMPLGVSPKQKFQGSKLRLNPGEFLTLYTDGITEAMNADREIYGRDRLGSLIVNAANDVDGLIKDIVDDVDAFCDRHPQRDDMCVVCIHREA